MQWRDVHFEFRGKSGVSHAVDRHATRVLRRIVEACRDLPGQELFQYVDDGGRQSIGSSDVNAYLRRSLGSRFTAKDFRTWGGTVLAACALARTTPQRTKRAVTQQVVSAVKAVAKKLGNTAAVCKKCYIHPAVLAAYAHGAVIDSGRSTASLGGANALRAEEKAVVNLILGERDSIEGRTEFHLSYAR